MERISGGMGKRGLKDEYLKIPGGAVDNTKHAVEGDRYN